jgi:MFS-type transporter involved in bile tolerance (Atg22 family)
LCFEIGASLFNDELLVRTISAQTLGQASTAGDGLGSIDGSITRAVGHGDFAVEQRL